AKPKGLRIVEDIDTLQVVVDPFQILDEEDEDESESEGTVTADGEVNEISPAAANTPHDVPNPWEDGIIPSQTTRPATTRRGGGGEGERIAVPRASAGPAPPIIAAGGIGPPGSAGPREEEVVAARYAELDARRPKVVASPVRPAGTGKAPAGRTPIARQALRP